MKLRRAGDSSLERAKELRRLGQREQALRLCEAVVAKDTSHHRAFGLLGTLELEAGRPARAARWLARAVELAPLSPTYWSNLGIAYHRTGSLEEAARALAKAVQLGPQRAEPVFNLASVLLDRGERDAGIACMLRAAELDPTSAATERALARELELDGRFSEARAALRRARELAPRDLDLRFDLLRVLDRAGAHPEAEHEARSLLALEPPLPAPKSARAHASLGYALAKRHKHADAVRAYERALELDPSLERVPAHLAQSLAKLGCLEAALTLLEAAVERFPTLHATHSELLFWMPFSPERDAERLLDSARLWNERHAPKGSVTKPPASDRDPERRLRVGYVSPDFRNHVQRFFTVPVFRHHDHANFEIIAYSSVETPDAWTEQLRRLTDGWRDVAHKSDRELAELVRNDGIDVLVDLTMHMSGSRARAFAEKPSPVQICWLAYPGTTGVGAIDYRLTDPHLDPPDGPLPYGETSLWLPNCFWCYDPLADEPETNELPALTAGHVTFGCLNNFAKANRGVLELWARVLAAVPRSRLLLRAPRGWARDLTLELLRAGNVEASRVEFVDVQDRGAYLASYRRIDIALDTFPYNGHTTSLDALWMGVPVVTLVGRTAVGRAGLCQAHQLGLVKELVATTPDEFVARAEALAGDTLRLAALRRELPMRLRRSPLMDAPRFARDLEALFREAWRRYCR
jgi:predicted O-linked N-acetylglucosamine transferase (SPINDLY family)